jgi:flagellar biosynthesis protein FlhG
MTMQHVLSGRASLRDIRMITPAGPALIPGASGVRQMANLSDQELLIFGEKLGELAAQEDLLILDVGAGIAPQTLLTLLCSNHVLLVTQPEIAALTDAYAVIKVLAKLQRDSCCSVVVNRVVRQDQGQQAFDKLKEVAQKHTGVDLQYLGEVAEDPTVTQRRLGQQPLVATDPAALTSKSIEAIAQRLGEIAGPLSTREVNEGEGLFDRFSQHRLFL